LGNSGHDLVSSLIAVVSVEGQFDPRDVALHLVLGYQGKRTAAFHFGGKKIGDLCRQLGRPLKSLGKTELVFVIGESALVVLVTALVVGGGVIEIADLEFETGSSSLVLGSSSLVLEISSLGLEISSLVLGISSLVFEICSLVFGPLLGRIGQ